MVRQGRLRLSWSLVRPFGTVAGLGHLGVMGRTRGLQGGKTRIRASSDVARLPPSRGRSLQDAPGDKAASVFPSHPVVLGPRFEETSPR
eukprot:8694565-Pyramimonas_sp.AAC.1